MSWPATMPRPGQTIRRVTRRLRRAGLLDHLLGLWLRRRFQRAGILVVRPGWPLPHVENHGGRIEAESCAFFPGVRLECWRGATLRIGNGTYLNRNTEVVAAGSVTIGRDCMIARDVLIMDTDQHALPGRELVVRPVVIEDRVWIGSRAIILKGVTIGHDSVIGAGAIVTRSVPPASVVAGPAARVIRTLDLGPDAAGGQGDVAAEARG
jgi:acetyltransferase-like isoleucine patch superfamily enzyme